jgi:G protein-coupled receptor Mth (Methuselah protein)
MYPCSTLRLCQRYTYIATDAASGSEPDCPYVRLSQNEFSRIMNVTSSNCTSTRGDVIQCTMFVGDDVLLCLSAFQQATWWSSQTTGTKLADEDPLEVALSYGCMGVSCLCLLLSIATYCTFPTLRTLPGRNTLNLMCSLMFAQLWYLCSVGLSDYPVVCVSAAIVTHYAWLCVFMWMFLCTFHMWRIFRSVHSPAPESENTITGYRYMACGYSIPALLVATSTVFEFCNCVPFQIGYGSGAICFITSRYALVVTFVGPLGVVLLVNAALFVMIVVHIRSSSSAHASSNSNRCNAAIYARMSSLMGLTWMFGILAAITNIDALWYVFIITNGLNGVTIFISYICKRNVVRLWQGLLCGGETR